jgi:DNA-binding MarR family transcriptional regulator
LRRATRAITQVYDAALRPSGLRNTQFTLLVLVQGLGPIGVGELAEHSGTDRTTLTRNLALLERDGLVSSESGDDARVRLFSLTPAGVESADTAFPLWERAQKRIVTLLGADDVGALLRDVRKLEQAIIE